MIAAGADSNCDALVRQSGKPQFGDYQANGIMAAAKKLNLPPRELAQRVIDQLDLAELVAKVEIAGHADSVGSEDYNLNLSQQRADEVKKYLVNKGVSSARLNAIGYGETQPVADNATPEGRKQNRRVDFKVKN